jgi:DinB family protein
MQAPTELHPALRTGWHFAEKVRQELREAIRSLTAVQWIFRHEPRSWCVGQVVDHLVRAEIGSSKMVRKLIRGDYHPLEFPVGATVFTADLDRYPYGHLDAPHDLVPGPLADRPELEQELALVHSRFRLELERFTGDDPEALRSPDPATGIWFTLGGWVKLQAWHEAHHLAQIQRIAASSGFPR